MLRRALTLMGGRCGAAVHGYNDADELGELIHVVESAPHHKHMVGHVIDIVPHAFTFRRVLSIVVVEAPVRT